MSYKTIVVHGDMHSIAAHNGLGGASPGGLKVIGAAPFSRPASQKGTWTSGPYPATGSAVVRQYGHVQVVDDGGSLIEVVFNGYDTTDVAQVTLQASMSAVAGSGGSSPVLGWWDGTQIIPVRIPDA